MSSGSPAMSADWEPGSYALGGYLLPEAELHRWVRTHWPVLLLRLFTCLDGYCSMACRDITALSGTW